MNLHTDVPLTSTAQVIVVGGGLGGVAAAIASARTGAKTLLIERNGFLGGVATAGLCCSLFNCCFSDDGRQMIHGPVMDIIAELAEKAGPGPSWKSHRGHMIFDMEKAKFVLLDFAKREGVQVRLFTTVTAVEKDGSRINGIYVAGRNGLEYLAADLFVDATGDSDLAVLAGCSYRMVVGKASYLFRMGNVDLDRFVGYFRQNPKQYTSRMDVDWDFSDALRQYDENGTFLFPHGGGLFMDIINEAIRKGEFTESMGTEVCMNAFQMHGIRSYGTVHIITGFTAVPSLDAETLTDRVYEGKQMAFYVADFVKRHFPGFENSFVSATADDLGIRVSRVVHTRKKLVSDQPDAGAEDPDEILGRCLIITHVQAAENCSWSSQRLGNECFDVLLSNLLPKNGAENLIMGAGRSVNSRVRVMVDTMVVGQGAGIAAGVAAGEGGTFADLDLSKVQNELRKQGVMPEIPVAKS